MKLLMKVETSLRIPSSQVVPMAPAFKGTGNPKKLNHRSSWGSVIRITHHRIHFVKPPPIANVVPPSSRKATPARTRQMSAIAGRSWMRRRTMSARICGVGMLTSGARPQIFRLRNSADALQHPELEQARYTGYCQQHRRSKQPAAEGSPGHKRDNCTKDGAAGSNRRDNVADPVDEIKKRSFRLRSRLPLNRNIELRGCPESLRPQKRRATDHAHKHQRQSDSRPIPNPIHLDPPFRVTPKSQSADKGNERFSRKKMTEFFGPWVAENDEPASL